MAKPPLKRPIEPAEASAEKTNLRLLPGAKASLAPVQADPPAPATPDRWRLSEVPENSKDLFWTEILFQFKADHRVKLVGAWIKLVCVSGAALITMGLAVLLSLKLFCVNNEGLIGAGGMMLTLGGVLYVFRRAILVFLLGDKGGKL